MVMEEELIFGLSPECYECRLNKYVYGVNLPEKEKEIFIKTQFDKIKQAPKDMSNKQFQDMLKEEFNKVTIPLDFSIIKKEYNQKIMDMIPSFKEELKNKKDPLLYALKLALVGNYIDFDALEVDDDELIKLITNVEEKEIDEEVYKNLKADFALGKSLVYFTDNCGEIVFDKLFIEEIKKNYPQLKITVMVRGAEVINDASMIDAKQIKLDEVCDVVDNSLPDTNTKIERMADDRRKLVKEADLLISKGQANAEALNGCGLNIYYIFLCKCNKFANNYKAKKFDAILCRDRKNH